MMIQTAHLQPQKRYALGLVRYSNITEEEGKASTNSTEEWQLLGKRPVD